jgi:hypothetical protein
VEFGLARSQGQLHSIERRCLAYMKGYSL